jgi:hypothetical protein
MSDSTLVMVGLHDSGKSTYIAAAFHTLKVTSDGGLALRELPEDREYLLDLEENWLNLRPVGHSAHGLPTRIELPLVDAQFGDVELTIPDISGESFDRIWETNEWAADVVALLERARGLMVFVRANDVEPPELIDVGNTTSTSDSPEVLQWSPEMAPTQTKLVDLLEGIEELLSGTLPRIAVVISAWDSVEQQIAPNDWLHWKVPLLSQWLTANSPPIEWQSFAVSAQGDDLDAEGRERLMKVDRVERTGGPSQLLAPLRWLLGGQ